MPRYRRHICLPVKNFRAIAYLKMFVDVLSVVRDPARSNHWIAHQLKADFSTQNVRHIASLCRHYSTELTTILNIYKYIYLYIYIYQCLGYRRTTTSGRVIRTKYEATPGADRKNIQKIFNIHVRSTRPLIVQIYTVRLTPLCTGVFLYIAGVAMPGKYPVWLKRVVRSE